MGASLHEIAKNIQKSCSTVSRGLKRNSDGSNYSPSKSQAKYQQRKGNCGRSSLLSASQVFEVVRERFCEGQCSPEEISTPLGSGEACRSNQYHNYLPSDLGRFI